MQYRVLLGSYLLFRVFDKQGVHETSEMLEIWDLAGEDAEFKSLEIEDDEAEADEDVRLGL